MVLQSRVVFRDETDFFFQKLSNKPELWQKDGWKTSTDFGY